MQIARRSVAEQTLQINLTRGRIEQVGAAHHVGNALRRVIYHDGKLVGELSVGAEQHEITDFFLYILSDLALHLVDEANRRRLRANTNRARVLSWRKAVATGTRINARASDGDGGIGDFFSRATADIGMPGELCQRLTVKAQPPALMDHFAVPFQAKACNVCSI